MASNPITTVVKNDEKAIDHTRNQAVNNNDELLIEPIVAFNDNKSVAIPRQTPTILQRISGILYVLLSSFLYTISMFIAKQLKVDLLDVLILRFLLQAVMLIIYMKFIKHYSFYKQRKENELLVLLINALFSATGYLALFLGYRYLPLADLITVRYTQVIWTVIIAAIIYCEKPSIPVILAVLLTMTGVIFVAQPDFLFEKTSNITKMNEMEVLNANHHQHLIGLLIVLYTSIALAIAVISNKELLQKYKTKQSLIMLQFAFVSFCMLMINLVYKYYLITEKVESFKTDFLNWRYLFASFVCLSQIISSVLIQKALKLQHPSIYTIVKSSDILFSIFLQNVFTSNKSNLISLIGSMLVLISLLIVGGFKFTDDNKTTKKNVSSDMI